MDSFPCFPYDIWVKCVRFAAYGEVGGPLPFLLVSQQWRKNIIETPELWTSLMVDDSEECAARNHTHLHLSKNLPIDLHIRYPRITWEHLTLALHASSRIRAIIVKRYNNEDQAISFDQLHDFLDKGAPSYPAMKEYIVEGFHGLHSVYGFFRKCPKLIRVQLLTKFAAYPASDLHAFSSSVVEIPILLHKQGEARFLEGRTDFTSLSIFNEQYDDYLQPQFQKKSIRFKKLYYRVTRTRQFESFLTAAYPELHTLTVTLPPMAAQRLFETLGSLPKLKVLEIDGLIDEPTIIWTQSKRLEHPRLFKFTFRIGNLFDLKHSGVESLLIQIAETRVLECAKELTIGPNSAILVPIPLTALLRATPRLRILNLHRLAGSSLNEDQVVQLPELEVLRLNDINNFGYIQAPKLEFLTAQDQDTGQPTADVGWKDESLVGLTTDLGSFERLRRHVLMSDDGRAPFSALRSIKWNGMAPEIGNRTLLLSAITHVSFNSHDGYYETTVATIDYFCLSILQHPDSCPALESLTSSAYPFWDLLFTVLLRRRNRKHLKQINSVTLPGYPFVTILRMLVDALKGSGSEGEALIDTVIQRRLSSWNYYCSYCVTSGHQPCNLVSIDEIIWPRSSADQFDFVTNSVNDLLLFPISEVGSIAADGGSGTRDWQWWQRKLQERQNPRYTLECTRQAQQPVSITPFTLD